MPSHVHGQSLRLTLPPLGIVILKLEGAPLLEDHVEAASLTVDQIPPNVNAN